jgi:hypothetical protein
LVDWLIGFPPTLQPSLPPSLKKLRRLIKKLWLLKENMLSLKLWQLIKALAGEGYVVIAYSLPGG